MQKFYQGGSVLISLEITPGYSILFVYYITSHHYVLLYYIILYYIILYYIILYYIILYYIMLYYTVERQYDELPGELDFVRLIKVLTYQGLPLWGLNFASNLPRTQ